MDRGNLLLSTCRPSGFLALAGFCLFEQQFAHKVAVVFQDSFIRRSHIQQVGQIGSETTHSATDIPSLWQYTQKGGLAIEAALRRQKAE
jgi:hypothetical protein